MTEEKGLFAGLFDFAFRTVQSNHIVKVLYIVSILGGGVGLVAEVVLQMQQSPAMGLLTLVFGLVAYFLWILCTRMALEVVLAVVRVAENIERATRGSN